MSQEHAKFKVFISEPLTDDRLSPQVSEDVQKFVAESGVAPKSVGIEFLENKNKIVLSIGYRDDEPGYPVKLTCLPLGKLDLESSSIEKAFSEAVAPVSKVICHEFYVSDDGDFFLIVLAQA